MVKQAEFIASCWGNDCARRQSRMSRPLDLDEVAKQEAEQEVADISFRPTDKYKLKLDEDFRKATKRRFSHWEETLKSVNEVPHQTAPEQRSPNTSTCSVEQENEHNKSSAEHKHNTTLQKPNTTPNTEDPSTEHRTRVHEHPNTVQV